MTGRRGLTLTMVACALSGLLPLLAAGRQWGEATVTVATGGRVHLSVSGATVAPSLRALGIALLALAAAIVAARGVLRRVVGLVVVATGGALIAVAVHGYGHVPDSLRSSSFGVQLRSVPAHRSLWWLLALAGGALAVVVGAWVVVRAGALAGMGAKYEPPTPRGETGDPAVSAWDALDRGDDPTVTPRTPDRGSGDRPSGDP